jgi:hypothetical protein
VDRTPCGPSASRFFPCAEFTQQDVSAGRHAPRTACLHVRPMHAAGHLADLWTTRPSPYSPRHASAVLRQKREVAVCCHRLAAIVAPPQPLLLRTTTSLPNRRDAHAPSMDGCSGYAGGIPPPTPADHVPPSSNHRNRALGEPTSLPHLFPAKSGLLLAGFWSSPPAMAPEGYIALISVLPGLFP